MTQKGFLTWFFDFPNPSPAFSASQGQKGLTRRRRRGEAENLPNETLDLGRRPGAFEG